MLLLAALRLLLALAGRLLTRLLLLAGLLLLPLQSLLLLLLLARLRTRPFARLVGDLVRVRCCSRALHQQLTQAVCDEQQVAHVPASIL